MGSWICLSYVYITESLKSVGKVWYAFFVILLIIIGFSAKIHFDLTDLFKVCCQKCWNSCCRNFLTALSGG